MAGVCSALAVAMGRWRSGSDVWRGGVPRGIGTGAPERRAVET